MNWAQPFFSSYGASSLNTCAYCGRLRDLPIVRGHETCAGCGAPILAASLPSPIVVSAERRKLMDDFVWEPGHIIRARR